MMTNDQAKYMSTEIVQATGLKRTVVLYRAKKLGITFPCSYDQVKQIMSYKSKGPGFRRPRKAVIDRLKMALKNDGYKVVMDK